MIFSFWVYTVCVSCFSACFFFVVPLMRAPSKEWRSNQEMRVMNPHLWVFSILLWIVLKMDPLWKVQMSRNKRGSFAQEISLAVVLSSVFFDTASTRLVLSSWFSKRKSKKSPTGPFLTGPLNLSIDSSVSQLTGHGVRWDSVPFNSSLNQD